MGPGVPAVSAGENTISTAARQHTPNDGSGPAMDSRLAAAHDHYHAGRRKKAEVLVQQALRRDTGNPRALHLLGLIARGKGRTERAIQLLAKAAANAPDAGDILCDLGNAYKAAGRFEDAIACHVRVAELLPGSAEAQSNLGAAYNAAGMADEAVACFERAQAARPDSAEILYNLGNGLLAAGQPEAAEQWLRRAVAADPAHVRARTNLGTALKEQGRLSEAIETFRGLIQAAPEHADIHWNLSLALIMDGQYGEGWREYEWRRHMPGFAMYPIDGRNWDGGGYKGKTLLIHAEQGFGDTIQFARYLPMAADSDGALVFVCQQPIKALLAGLDGGFELRGSEEHLPSFDLHAPLMSLPHLLHVGQPVWPVDAPYLYAQSARADLWAERLSGERGLKVGICWQGRPDYKADRRRSIPLEAFAPIAGLDGVRLISLQKEHGAGQLAEQGWRDRVLDFGAELDADDAFLDTAAIITALDVVVTSDTAIAHLAGALGARVWLMLAEVPDWRWGTGGDRTPWYPTMRLFRQTRAGDWPGVMSRVVTELEVLRNG